MLRKYLAELLGTFVLTFGVATLARFSGPTPIIAALTVMLFVYTVGSISGAFFNPAVTIGMYSIQKLNAKDTVFYVLFQILGAVCALLLGKIFWGEFLNIPADGRLVVAVVEGMGAFLLTFGVSSVAFGKVKESVSGVVVGASLFLGVMLTTGISNGVINPAIALGLGSVNLAYVLGPVVGAVLGAWSYKLLVGKK